MLHFTNLFFIFEIDVVLMVRVNECLKTCNVEIKFFIIINQYFFWVVAHDIKKVIAFIGFQFSEIYKIYRLRECTN